MGFATFVAWLHETSVATAIRESTFLFPTIETVHVVALTLVVGSISIVDLRLLGLASRGRAVTLLTAEILPLTWVAFAIAAVAGFLLFSSEAVKYSQNLAFQLKMVLMVLAGLNMGAFHLITSKGIEHWDTSPGTPLAAKLAGGLSLLLWIGIVACGRVIGFTMAQF